jgi:hypothetical protein
MLGCVGDEPLDGYTRANRILYDGLTDPGTPYFNPDYDPMNLTASAAVVQGQARCQSLLDKLGPDFTRKIEPNQFGVAMTKALREKRKAIVERVKTLLSEE